MRVLEEKLGEEKAEAIGKKALHDYEQIFKKDYMTSSISRIPTGRSRADRGRP